MMPVMFKTGAKRLGYRKIFLCLLVIMSVKHYDLDLNIYRKSFLSRAFPIFFSSLPSPDFHQNLFGENIFNKGIDIQIKCRTLSSWLEETYRQPYEQTEYCLFDFPHTWGLKRKFSTAHWPTIHFPIRGA